MRNKELRKLSRRDLLELLLQQEQENERLNLKIAELEKAVTERYLSIENAGSMAEASLALSGIFEAADKAVAQYKDNLKRSSEEQKKAYDRIVLDAKQRAAEIIQAAEKEKQRKIAEIDAHWCQIKKELDDYCRNHAEAKGLLSQAKNE